MVQILEKNREYVIVCKPVGIPSQSDPTGDSDAMSIVSDMLFAQGDDSALWLVHRLDRAVGGLLVFARTKRAAAELSRSVADGNMKKRYLAVAEGQPDGGEYRDYLYKDARISKAFVVDRKRAGVKEAVLECAPIVTREALTLCKINLACG